MKERRERGRVRGREEIKRNKIEVTTKEKKEGKFVKRNSFYYSTCICVSSRKSVTSP